MYQAPVHRSAHSRLATPDLRLPRDERANSGDVMINVPPTVGVLSLLALLSSREHEIVVLVARGLSNKEVALELAISPWTVSAHLRRIFTKLDVKRRIELCLLVTQC